MRQGGPTVSQPRPVFLMAPEQHCEPRGCRLQPLPEHGLHPGAQHTCPLRPAPCGAPRAQVGSGSASRPVVGIMCSERSRAPWMVSAGTDGSSRQTVRSRIRRLTLEAIFGRVGAWLMVMLR